jgi:hypothetical protein
METDDRLTSNKIPLDKALADEFVGFQKNIRENIIAMSQKAFETRSQYLTADFLLFLLAAIVV